MAAMNVLFSVVVIGLFSSCLGARVGESCASSSCDDLGAYCEPLGQTCECNTGWLQNGQNCSRTSGTECHVNMCSDPSNMICSNSLCTCDSSKKLDAGTTNQEYCQCPTGYVYSSDKEMCLSEIGYPCSSVSDCVVTDGIKCSSSKCACDTTYIYSSGSKGSTSCSCDTSKTIYSSSSGVATCKIKVGKSCSSSTTCVDNASCSSGKCVCDANKHFVTTASGDQCECDSTNGYIISNGECLLKNNRTCTSDSQCLSYFTCGTEYFDPEQICECSSAKNFAQGTADDTTCACINSSYTAQSTATNGCLLFIDAPVSCTQNSECISNYCNSTTNTCDCDRSAHKTANGGKTACVCDDGLGYTLDSTSSTCLLKNKEACTSSSECASGYCDTVTTHQCTCDGDIYESESGVAACLCSTGYQRDSSNNCVGKIGYACSSDSNCVSGLVCDSSLCACDSSKNYDTPGSTGSTYCSCATGYTSFNGTCYLNIGETCSSDSGCYPGNGIYCDLTSKQCACNASDYWEKNTDTSCQCMTDYLENDNECAIIETKACNYTEGSRPCVQGAICDKATKLCKCDGTKNYESGSSGSCNCKTNFVSQSNPDRCVAKVGGPCTASNETNVCVSNSECSAPTTSTTNYTCTCSKTAYWDGSCSGAANLVASMTVLISALFVASRQ